jgi:hypothetical protein
MRIVELFRKFGKEVWEVPTHYAEANMRNNWNLFQSTQSIAEIRTVYLPNESLCTILFVSKDNSVWKYTK